MVPRVSTTPRIRVDQAQRVVVKIGTRILVDERHELVPERLAGLVGQMAELRRGGREVVCVSSGAIAAGLGGLGASRRPRDLPSLQAAAAIGQARLIELYRTLFSAHGLTAAQVLLTHADLRSRERHLNAANTFNRLLECGAVPIVNENDTVAVDEIRVGDNDLLSALVACLVRADLLVMLTDAEGLLVRPPAPGRGDGEAGELVRVVERVTPEIFAMAGGSGSAVATGGMRSKIMAADMASRAGIAAVIAAGSGAGVLTRILAGEAVGTLVLPRPRRLRGRQGWIAFFDRPAGDLRIDEGARRAITQRGGSLLAVGVAAVTGTFGRGAPVRIVGTDGSEIGRGLVNYAADDLRRILGKRSQEIAAILGACEYDEVVHRDNLVLSGGA